MNLLEYSYFETTDMFDTLLKYAGQDLYIHFSDIKKIGINPNKSHGDIHGIYFYPVDWILNSERAWKGHQYGVSMKYFFIVKIDKSTHGLDLSKVTQQYFNEIMLKYDMYKKITIDEFSLLNKLHPIGKKLYKVFEYDDKSQKDFYKEFEWVSDSQGIFHIQEPEQICVRKSSIIDIIDFGMIRKENERSYRRNGYQILSLLKDKIGNGELYWDKKNPVLKTNLYGMNITFDFDSSGLQIRYAIDSFGNKYNFSLNLIKIKNTLRADKVRPLIPEIFDEVWTMVNSDIKHLRKNKIDFDTYSSMSDIQSWAKRIFKDANLKFTINDDLKEVKVSEDLKINDKITLHFSMTTDKNGCLYSIIVKYKKSTISSYYNNIHNFEPHYIAKSFNEDTGLSDGNAFLGILSKVLNVDSTATEDEKNHLMLELERIM